MNRIAVTCLSALLVAPVWAQQPSREVYRCPGNPPLYTDALTAKEAREKGCRTLEGAPITVVQMPKPRTGTPVPVKADGARSPAEKVDPNSQRARDSDRRQILEGELKREEDRLAALQKEFNNGEPERRGDERNYQKYLDRTAGLKADIERSESDLAAIKRELGKLAPPAAAASQ